MNIIKKINLIFLTSGINLRVFLNSIKGFPFFLKSYFKIAKEVKNSLREFPINGIYPCLADKYENSGVASGHYFHQDLLVARKIFIHNPKKHVDIGSRVDGFVAHVACFRTIEVFDVRKLDNCVPGIEFKMLDLMSPNFNMANYCDSISSLHAIEHFGLGRYGDNVDYYGYSKGLDNIYQMLSKGGKFYFSVPIGEQRIEFNAHRVFSIKYLLELFNNKYHIDSFSYVDDSGKLHIDINLDQNNINNNFNCIFGCGIFELTKL